MNIYELAPNQAVVAMWMENCFGPEIPYDKVERNYRFFEEAAELVQSLDMSREDAHKLVDYVYNRPVGLPRQEVGGVHVTMMALCTANYLDYNECADTEVARINTPETMEKIRAKQAAKPIRSPLPEAVPVTEVDEDTQEAIDMLSVLGNYSPSEGAIEIVKRLLAGNAAWEAAKSAAQDI